MLKAFLHEFGKFDFEFCKNRIKDENLLCANVVILSVL